MRVINLDRGKGKTSLLVSACYINNIALIVHSERTRDMIRKGYPFGKDIEIYTIFEVLDGRAGGIGNRIVYVDEMDIILEVMFNRLGLELKAGTITV